MKDYKKYKKAKKEQNTAKAGQVAGAGVGLIGGAALGTKYALDQAIKASSKMSQEEVQKLANELAKKGKSLGSVVPQMEASSKKLKKVGLVALPAGVALTTASTILKNQSSKKLKEFGNDNSKKKK